MPSVSLNVDLEDVAVLRRALAAAGAACPCQAGLLLPRCAECTARWALVREIDRMLERRGCGRTAVSVKGVAFTQAVPAGTTTVLPTAMAVGGWQVMRGGRAED